MLLKRLPCEVIYARGDAREPSPRMAQCCSIEVLGVVRVRGWHLHEAVDRQNGVQRIEALPPP